MLPLVVSSTTTASPLAGFSASAGGLASVGGVPSAGGLTCAPPSAGGAWVPSVGAAVVGGASAGGVAGGVVTLIFVSVLVLLGVGRALPPSSPCGLRGQPLTASTA